MLYAVSMVTVTLPSVCCPQTNQIGVTEHIEGDECKFALWSGTVAPTSDYKIILRVSHCYPGKGGRGGGVGSLLVVTTHMYRD